MGLPLSLGVSQRRMSPVSSILGASGTPTGIRTRGEGGGIKGGRGEGGTEDGGHGEQGEK